MTMTRQERGKLGGLKRKEKYGLASLTEMARRGGRTTAERYGTEYYQRIGKKGGMAPRRKKQEQE